MEQCIAARDGFVTRLKAGPSAVHDGSAVSVRGTHDAFLIVMIRRCSLVFACSVIAAACGAHQTSGPPSVVARQPPAVSSSGPASNKAAPGQTAANRPSPVDQEEAHRFLTAATACWLGGVWSDAKGISDENARAEAADRRCHQFVVNTYGTDDKLRYERVRAVEVAEVAELTQKMLGIARRDSVNASRQQNLARLFDAIADAQRETMHARRAGDRVKKDTDNAQDYKRTKDEDAAVGPLSESKAFNALLNLDVGDLTPEARAIAILCATDRMEIARGLPKHLKVYAVEGPYMALFGVQPPEVPSRGSQSMRGGEWLAYVTTVANAAGHPVPPQAKSLTDKELLAWGGSLEGLADKLRAEALQISEATPLKRASDAVVLRLDNEYRNSMNHVLREPEPAAPPKPYGPPPK